MGDVSDTNDLERFMRSPEGEAQLEEIRRNLVGRTIQSVSFTNNVHCIVMEMALDDGTCHEFSRPELDVDAIRENYDEVLEREYLKDYPQRA